MTLLYQILDLKHDSKPMNDDERLVNAVIRILDKCLAPGSHDIKQVASTVVSIESSHEASISASSSYQGHPRAGAKRNMFPFPSETCGDVSFGLCGIPSDRWFDDFEAGRRSFYPPFPVGESNNAYNALRDDQNLAGKTDVTIVNNYNTLRHEEVDDPDLRMILNSSTWEN
ncbi:hypothetical protein BKA56DRAFT_625595 [Ilyonectria sp. MPI-CAGE-AT-0026]|nr:hypothetical protein BKA56DRAFT_625595 [Ilyonectria sp. MPI-CAGE-AT-0026]